MSRSTIIINITIFAQQCRSNEVKISCHILPFKYCIVYFGFAGGKTPDVGSRTYTDIMKEQMLRGEETEVITIRFKITYLSVLNIIFYFGLVEKENIGKI